jgi:hypothetical protein
MGPYFMDKVAGMVDDLTVALMESKPFDSIYQEENQDFLDACEKIGDAISLAARQARKGNREVNGLPPFDTQCSKCLRVFDSSYKVDPKCCVCMHEIKPD